MVAVAAAEQRPRRIEIIDGARGAAMLLVFLAHFIDAYYFVGHGLDPIASARKHYFKVVTQIATPAFVLISGITLATLYARHGQGFRATRERLIDRGLFLILVAHPLMVGGVRFVSAGWSDALRVVFVTDTIGGALIVGSLLMGRLGTRSRVRLGAALLLGSWVTMASWNPTLGTFAWRAKDLLVGDWRDHWLYYNFPPLPWFGVYLIATGLGAAFAQAHALGKLAAFRVHALLASAVAVAVALAASALLHAAARRASLPVSRELCRFLGDLTSKLPPAPCYLLLYGGLALGLFAGLTWAQETMSGRRFIFWVAPFGRHSVPAFIAQFYVYFIGVLLLPRPSGFLTPLYFGVTVALLRFMVTLWDRTGAATLLTVGYPAFARRMRAAVETAADPGDHAIREARPR